MEVRRIIWSIVGISIMAGLMAAAVVWGYMSRPAEEACKAIEYDIEDRAERMYLTESELTGLLQQQDIYPVGRRLNQVSLHRIEKAIGHHPMVRSAECYLTAQQIVRVRLTQRVPVLRVQTPIDTYLIDSDRKVMQARQSVRDEVMIVRGAVGVQIASGVLADFAQWVKKEPYWHERIDHLYIQSPQMIYLYLKDEGTKARIVMGNMRDYERKMKKLKWFLTNTPQEIKDKPYTELDLRYKGQVVGRY